MSEIAPHIHRIETRLGERLLAQHLLVGAERLYLIDTGIRETPQRHLFPYLEETLGCAPQALDGVVVSHSDTDHCGGNEAVRRRAPGAFFMAHRRDAPLVESAEKCLNQRYDFTRPYGFPFPEGTRRRLRDDFGRGTPVDVGLRGGERLRLAPDRYVEILHLPGHTAGHLAVHDPDEDVLVACDAVLGRAMRTAEGALFSAPTYRHQEDYLRTIERIRELDPRLLLTSHLPPIQPRASVQAFLDESEAFVHELNEALLDRLDDEREALPLPQIVERLDDFVANGRPLASDAPAYSFCFPLAAALDAGVRSGALRRTTLSDDVYAYSTA